MWTRVSSQSKSINTYIQKVYFWMFLGLMITTVAAYFGSQDPGIIKLLGNEEKTNYLCEDFE